jgi:hypothetical protein
LAGLFADFPMWDDIGTVGTRIVSAAWNIADDMPAFGYLSADSDGRETAVDSQIHTIHVARLV